MQYNTHGRTGLKVSRLGFGAMRLPQKGGKVDDDLAVPMIRRAFELGVNYIDTAVMYCHDDSQRAVGVALKGWRDKIILSTKNHHMNKHDDRPWWKHLEDSLRLMDVDFIDIYNFHGLNWQAFVDHVKGPDGQLKWMQKAKDQGLIRHICFSFHDTPEALRKLAETREFDAVTLQYNLIDRRNEPVLADCKKAGLGITIMGPVGGGRLGGASEAIRKMVPGARSVPEVALRFVLANPNVTIALSGMTEMQHVEENCRVAAKSSPLTATEKRRVKSTLARFKKLSELYCTGCNYCMPCPAGVDIPGNFMALNYHKVYDLPDVARASYRGSRGKASRCLACGKCMSKCPQKIDIIGQLRETVRTLDDAYGKLLVNVEPTESLAFARNNGTYSATVKCKLECQNLSDQETTPDLRFNPARGVNVTLARKPGQIDPFGRSRNVMTVEGSALKDGQPLALEPSLAGDEPLVYTPDPLPVAIAPKATARTWKDVLKKAPRVTAKAVQGNVKRSAKAIARHAPAARFAFTASELVAEFDLRKAFRVNVNKTRGLGDSDRMIFYVVMKQALKVRKAKGCPEQFGFRFGFAADKPKTAVVEVPAPGLPAAQVKRIKADVSVRGGRKHVTLRIPWKVLQVQPPKPGARLGVNFAQVCYTGGSSYQLLWSKGDAYLLLAK